MGVTRLDSETRGALAPALAAGWLGVAAAAGLALAGVPLSTEARYAPLVASVVLFGLPHGAIDYVALPRAVAGQVTARWVAGVAVIYLALGGAYAAAWFLWPVAAAAAFVALTWFHWGQGDLYALLALADADHLESRTRKAATVAVRGGLPMLVPLLAHPDAYRRIVDAFAAPFGGTVATHPVFSADARLALGIGFAALTAATLAAGWRAGGGRAWRIDAAETLGLWLFFLATPPVFAVGVYFCLWHAVRHVARAATLDAASLAALRRGDRWRPLTRFARDAAPLTALALVLLAVLWTTVPNPPSSLAGGTALYLVFVAVLTLPHTAVVAWMDRAQGVWRPKPTEND